MRLEDRSSFVEMVEAGVGIGLKSAAIELEVFAWTFSLAVGRVGEPDGRSIGRTGWPVVANIGPEPPGFGLAGAGRKHRDRGVVGVQLACRENMIAHGLNQRREQFACCADPSGQRGAVEIDAFAGIDLRLTVERCVIGILRHQHMREQSRSCEAAIDGP
jgi:hypothetical protein